MPPADSGELAKLVNLGRPCCTEAVVYLELLNGKPVPMNAGDELPPETLLHGPEFIYKLIDDVLSNQDIRATGVMDRNAIEELIYAVKSTGHHLSKWCVRAIHPPPKDNIGLCTNIPKLCEVLGVALSIGIKTEQIRRLQRFHAVPDCS